MIPRRSRSGPSLPALAAAALGLGLLASACAAADLMIEGKVIDVPPPSGMAEDRALGSLSSRLGQQMKQAGKIDELVMFSPDSLVGSTPAHPARVSPFIHVASACRWPFGERTMVEARTFVDLQRKHGLGDLAGSPQDSAAIDRARRMLNDDPEGSTDRPLDLPLGKSVELGAVDMGEDGYGKIQLIAREIPLADGTTETLVYVRAMATVFVRDRPLFVAMSHDAPATTGGVSDVRREFLAWVTELVAQRSPAANAERPTISAPPDEPSDLSAPVAPGAKVERLPEVIERVEPAYPDSARAKGIQGTVRLMVLVSRHGWARDIVVRESVPELDAAAIRAVNRWHFRPGWAGGAPAAMWRMVPVTFTLP